MESIDEKSPSSPTQLAERILADVRASKRSGDRLPTERRLAEELGVTRTSVRHALSRLEAAGVLSREVGRGTFLREPPGGRLGPLDPMSDISPADVMAVRSLIEPPAMAIAVLRATERDLEEIDRCLLGGERAESFEGFEAWDRALHRCLVASSHNPLLVDLYSAVDRAREGQVWGRLKRRNDSEDRRCAYCAQHRAIVDAIQTRDGDGATAAMRDHLGTVSVNLFGLVV